MEYLIGNVDCTLPNGPVLLEDEFVIHYLHNGGHFTLCSSQFAATDGTKIRYSCLTDWFID